MQTNTVVAKGNARISGDEMVFLTNGACEETGQISEERLKALGLQFGEFDGSFYPLTDHEAQFIAEDLIEMGEFGVLTGYSVLFRGGKYLAPTIELDFFEDDDLTITKEEASRKNQALKPVLEAIAAQTGGHYCWESEPAVEFSSGDGKFVAELLIPFDYAEQNAHDFESWKQHLIEMGQKAQEPTTS
jgi:hypothetical protein